MDGKHGESICNDLIKLANILLLLFRAHYRTMREASIWRRSPVQKILLLFVESGTLFLLIQLLALIGQIVASVPNDSFTIILFAVIVQELWETTAVSCLCLCDYMSITWSNTSGTLSHCNNCFDSFQHFSHSRDISSYCSASSSQCYIRSVLGMF